MGKEDTADVMKSGVYRIDLGGGWFYVGSSKDLTKRDGSHRRALRSGSHSNKIVQRVFDKYGVFNFTILGHYPLDEIIEREQELLDKHCQDKKCANISIVAGSPMSGLKHSEQTRKNMSSSRTGREFSIEHRAALSAALKGRIFTSEHISAMSSAAVTRKRVPFTSEHCAKISAAKTGRKLSIKHRAAISAGGRAYQARLREAAAAAL
jgi:group I intron endonuclease